MPTGWMRNAVAATMNRDQVHFVSGCIAPLHLLDDDAVSDPALGDFRPASQIVEAGEILTAITRRQDHAAFDEQAEEADLASVERDDRVVRAVHDHDGRGTAACKPAFEVARRGL